MRTATAGHDGASKGWTFEEQCSMDNAQNPSADYKS